MVVGSESNGLGIIFYALALTCAVAFHPGGAPEHAPESIPEGIPPIPRKLGADSTEIVTEIGGESDGENEGDKTFRQPFPPLNGQPGLAMDVICPFVGTLLNEGMLENKVSFNVEELVAAGATINAGKVMEIFSRGSFGKYASAQSANWKTEQSVINLHEFSNWPALEHRFSTGISDPVTDWSKCNLEDTCQAQVKKMAIGAFMPPFMPKNTPINSHGMDGGGHACVAGIGGGGPRTENFDILWERCSGNAAGVGFMSNEFGGAIEHCEEKMTGESGGFTSAVNEPENKCGDKDALTDVFALIIQVFGDEMPGTNRIRLGPKEKGKDPSLLPTAKKISYEDLKTVLISRKFPAAFSDRNPSIVTSTITIKGSTLAKG
jgi:hypothetical protein